MKEKKEKGSLILSVYIVPRSSKTEIVGPYGDALKIKLNAPPVDGKANEELVYFLSKKLKISKSNIKMISGFNQKRKVLSITGLQISNIQVLLK
ncbi:MAG: YggU family protein [Candidatus Melainabacteria bacterium]|nr:YggU family protein [Candidatus Melainabacteria bacterium]MBI3308246.1 YggU family protein [Candidatus Melainabacteria bacterium]